MSSSAMHPVSGTLVVSGCLSIGLTSLGFLLYGFGSGPHDSSLLLKAFWLAPELAFPLFLTVLISRKWHRIAMWMLAFFTYCGEYSVIREGYVHGQTMLGSVPAVLRVPVIVVGCLSGPQVLLSIAIAVLVEYDCRRFLHERKMSLTGAGIKQKPERLLP